MLKLCQTCLFRAQDEAVICRTCGSANLIKLEVTHVDSSLQGKAHTYFQRLRDAKEKGVSSAVPTTRKLIDAGKPHVVAMGKWLASVFDELKRRLPTSADVISKLRAVLAAQAPLEKSRPRLVSAAISINRAQTRTVKETTYVNTSDETFIEVKQSASSRSLPVLLRAKLAARAPVVEEEAVSDRSLPVLLRNMKSKSASTISGDQHKQKCTCCAQT